MPNDTNTTPATTDWQDYEFDVIGPDDTLRASIHPGGDLVTLSYRAGDPLVLDVSHIDDLIGLLQCVKAAAK